MLRFFPSSPGSLEDRRRCVDIDIVDDVILEGTESFQVAISKQEGLDQPESDLTLLPSTAEVLIFDDDSEWWG